MNAISPHLDRARHKASLRRSFFLCTIDGVAAMPIVQMSLPVNVFLVALFTQAYALPKPTIGILTALPFICNSLQIAVSPFLVRWRPPHVVTVVTAAFSTAGWAAFGAALWWLPRDQPAAAGWWLGGCFFAISFFGALAGVSWNAWMQEWVPPRLRGKFFGRRNGLTQLSMLIFLLVAGWALARWDYALGAFQLIIAGAILLRVLCLYWQWIAPTPRPRHGDDAATPLPDQLRALRRARSLFVFIVFGSVWFFATNAFGPFYYVFLFEQLRFSAFDIGIFSTLSALGGALSMHAWGRLIDRYGNKGVMAFSLLLWQVQNYLWCFLTPENRALAYGMWLWGGVTSAGFVLGQFTVLLKLIPREAKNLAIGLNLAITSFVAAVAPILGGVALNWALTRWPGQALTVYHVCFLVQPTLCLLGIGVLLRMAEPQASNFTSLVGAMRNIRTLSGIFGLSFLADYLFYRPWKR